MFSFNRSAHLSVSHKCWKLQPRVPGATTFIVRTDRLGCFLFEPNYVVLAAAFILSVYVQIIKWKFKLFSKKKGQRRLYFAEELECCCFALKEAFRLGFQEENYYYFKS